jgi:hypothetical protein
MPSPVRRNGPEFVVRDWLWLEPTTLAAKPVGRLAVAVEETEAHRPVQSQPVLVS